MTDSTSASNNISILHNPERLARFKMSIGMQTRGDRPMTPVEVAFAIRDFADEIDGTIKDVARRLNVHEDTCRMFASILDLPKDWWGIWHFGQTDSSGRLPFSMAVKLSSRFRNNRLTKDDLDLLKGAALDPKKPARRDDITNILSYYSKNPEKTLEECIEAIMNLTPNKITHHVIITDIDPKFLSGMRPDDAETAKNTVLNILSKYFSKGAIKDMRIKDGRFLQIAFDEKGYDEFYDLAKKEKILAKNLVNHLCSELSRV